MSCKENTFYFVHIHNRYFNCTQEMIVLVFFFSQNVFPTSDNSDLDLLTIILKVHDIDA